jgi:pimeloyl-ACP methyl ester carboxylesterase
VPAGPATTPSADRVLTLPAGRRLGWAEWGDPHGRPVLLLHRSPGSRLFDPDAAATAAAGVRLLTLDRPGYGATDPVPVPTRAALAADVVAFVDALGLDSLALAGWSAGGQFALAAVPLLGARLRSLALLATPAPDEAVPWWPDQVRPVVELARRDPGTAATVLREPFSAFTDPLAAATADPAEADAEVRARPGVLDAIVGMMREAVRQGPSGVVSDAVAGMDAAELPLAVGGVPVHLWYGERDLIDPRHGRWYAAELPGAELHLLPDAGHLLPVTHWAEILRST